MIEERHKAAIDRYVERGCPTGTFIQCCLENDLRGAFGHADEDSRDNLYDIVHYMYNEIPHIAWGSKEKVKEWFKKFGVVPE